jgi:3-oxoadipate enol-lactonase
MPRQKVNGVELYYELHGPEDGEVIVLSNGIMMSTASWAFQKAGLSRHFQVLLYDCRGMWQSEHPQGQYSMEQHADDLAALLETLDIESAHIGGISYGAEISMVFALKYPEMTQSLIVIDGVSEIHPLLKAQTTPWLMAAERGDPELLLKTSYHMNFAEKWIKANLAFIENSVERYAELDMDALVRLMNAFFDLDITDRLPEITCPTLVVAGEEDLIKGREYAQIISDNIAGSEFAMIPGAGHALCIEKPGILNTLIIGFIRKHARNL